MRWPSKVGLLFGVFSALFTGPATAAETHVCQPGGDSVTNSNCMAAASALLIASTSCEGKVNVPKGVIGAKHGNCCATMWRDAGATVHSLDYLSAAFMDNVAVCQRGYTILDDGTRVQTNAEACEWVKIIGRDAIPDEEEKPTPEFRGMTRQALPEEAELAKRGAINVCGRDFNDLIDVPGLAAKGYELVQTTTGSGQGFSVPASISQSIYSQLISQVEHQASGAVSRLAGEYLTREEFSYTAMDLANKAANSWNAVRNSLGDSVLEQVIKKVVTLGSLSKFKSVSYSLRYASGVAVVEFIVNNYRQ
ncbi:uncharacterized protein Triagg1_5021 [Trichoderma aggressivum f. europaeum]|uniref:Uncharacterized protein n=1 Tax=Trichoderma aggressivum f. europaeum TaxID=173218 RepID=A0AAE1ID63_9HYPO|nr:hypothetical protein Triagg1_5021 [Trichoderma aggressivum f. europaeum]